MLLLSSSLLRRTKNVSAKYSSPLYDTSGAEVVLSQAIEMFKCKQNREIKKTPKNWSMYLKLSVQIAVQLFFSKIYAVIASQLSNLDTLPLLSNQTIKKQTFAVDGLNSWYMQPPGMLEKKYVPSHQRLISGRLILL